MKFREEPHPDCQTCIDYMTGQERRIAGAVYVYAEKRGMEPMDLAVEFMEGVHARHLAGLSLAVA